MSLGEGEGLDRALVATARRRGIGAEDASRLAGLLSLLGDPVRVRLLYSLDLVDELCVGDLALVLDVSEDAVSYGLRLLRTAGLVQTRKEGRVVFYRLADRFPEPLLEHCLLRLIELSRLASGPSQAARPRRTTAPPMSRNTPRTPLRRQETP
jgi:ArsR family transcriptional regulator, lead/cadmium/zinc/bismuth-responsive transcriptional repressor